MGWEPAEVTTYEYERAGLTSPLRWRWLRQVHEWLYAVARPALLVRSATIREPEFSLNDLTSLLANRADALALRGSHGHLLSESMNANADAASWESEFRYKARGPRKDHAQAALDAARKEYAAKYPDADMSALRWAAERVRVT